MIYDMITREWLINYNVLVAILIIAANDAITIEANDIDEVE